MLSDALGIQGKREVWLQEYKDAINTKIERGLSPLDRGEGIPGDQLRARLAADKTARLKTKDRSDL